MLTSKFHIEQSRSPMCVGIAITYLTEDDKELFYELRQLLLNSKNSVCPAELERHPSAQVPTVWCALYSVSNWLQVEQCSTVVHNATSTHLLRLNWKQSYTHSAEPRSTWLTFVADSRAFWPLSYLDNKSGCLV